MARARSGGSMSSRQAQGTLRLPRPTSAASRRREWVVYAKARFAGPKQVLAYLARYTHRVAIANSRLVALEDERFGELPLEVSRERPPEAQGHASAGRVHAPVPSPRDAEQEFTASATTACLPTATGADVVRALPRH